MAFAIMGILVGGIIGFILPYTYNTEYSLYITMIILVSLDSVFGGIRSNLEESFNIKIFLSDFFGNSLLTIFLTYIGDRLGVPLYYSAILIFGGKIFNNFSTIRRLILFKKKSI